jgi:phosphopantetheinyl transferase (holo-ACP synthase)
MPRSKKKLPLRIIFISVYCTVFEQVREILAARFAGKLALSKALQASEEDAKSDDNKLMLRDVIGR